MAKEETKAEGINALGAAAAYNLANVTKTKPQFGALTPKWLTKFLEFKGLETGIFRVNKVVEGETPLDVLCSQTKKSDIIPDGYVEYETEPREYRLNSISTIINVNTAIEDVYSVPYDQVQEQLGLAIESLRERQESQLINNDDYGLLKNIADSQRIQTRNGAPTPDDLDEAIEYAMGWSKAKQAIIEEFIDGKEYSGESIAYNGNYKLLVVTEKSTTGAPHFVETGHKQPADLSPEMLKKVEDHRFDKFTPEEKQQYLYDERKGALDMFLENGAISQEEYDMRVQELEDRMGTLE